MHKLCKRSCALVILFFASKTVASCCSSQSSFGIPRLLPHERALIELGSSVRYVYGSFDEHSRFLPGQQNNPVYLTFEEELVAMLRAANFLEPYARLPMRIQKSSQKVGAGLSDIALGVRLPLWRDNDFFHVPSLALISAVRIPTGASLQKDPSLNVEDSTGNGLWHFTFGLALEKAIHPVTLSVGYSFSFDHHHVENTAFKSGFMHSFFLSGAFMPHDKGSLSFSIAPTFYTKSSLYNEPIAYTNRHKISFSAGYSYSLHSHIKIQTALGADLPITFLGKNMSSEFFMRLGMRVGVF